MNKLKKILLKEATPFIPFSVFSNKVRGYWSNTLKGDHGGKGISRRFVTNVFVSIFSGIALLGYVGYIGGKSQPTGDLGYNSKKYLKEQFNQADINKNYVLDSTEFYNYMKKLE